MSVRTKTDGTPDRRARERVERHTCGRWVREGMPCDVCGPCTCDHADEWHGSYGCRGWVQTGDPIMPARPCGCRSGVFG